MPPTTMSHYVRALLDRGHAIRQAVPGDRRSYKIGLTASGLRAHANAGRAFAEADRRFSEAISIDEETARTVLAAIGDAATSAEARLQLNRSTRRPDMRARTGPLRVGETVAVVASIVIGCASPLTGGPAGSDGPAPASAASGSASSASGSASSASSSPSGASASRRASASPSVTRAPSAKRSATALSRDDGWRADIDALLEARERLHPNPWHDMHRAAVVGGSRRGEGRDRGPDRRPGPGRGRAPCRHAGLGRPRRPRRDLPLHAGRRHPRLSRSDCGASATASSSPRRGRRTWTSSARGSRRSMAAPSRTSWPSSSRSRRVTIRRTSSRTLRSICAQRAARRSRRDGTAGPATFTVVEPRRVAARRSRSCRSRPMLTSRGMAPHRCGCRPGRRFG